MVKLRLVKSWPPAARLEGPPGANSGATQSRGQLPILALQFVQVGIVTFWAPTAPGGLPQPALMPCRRLLAEVSPAGLETSLASTPPTGASMTVVPPAPPLP